MISVVVPVYNVENYLEACLESILASTYTDFELIVIDDGSTDSSGRLCDQVAARDQRVKVVHQENSGIAASRNLGIEMSSGEYLSFVDADDVVAPYMLERLLEALVADPECDFSMGRASTIHDDESCLEAICLASRWCGANCSSGNSLAKSALNRFRLRISSGSPGSALS